MNNLFEVNKFNRRELLKISGSVFLGSTILNFPTFSFAKTQSVSGIQPLNKTVLINYNENALGMSPKAFLAAKEAVASGNRYTLPEEHKLLLSKIALKHHVKSENILVTQGSTEAIRGSIDAFGLFKNNVQFVIPVLTYSDGEDFSKNIQIGITKVPMSENWEIDIDELKKAVDKFAGFSIVYIVNPNNPTGRVTSSQKINSWIESQPKNTFFIIDEAYADFINQFDFVSATSLVGKNINNFVVTRTFSKIYGMAGLRIGYAVANPEVLDKIKNFVSTDLLINGPAVAAAIASLDDEVFYKRSKAETNLSRSILLNAFDKLKIQYLPSESNFVFFRIDVPLIDLQENMKKLNIIIGRAFPPADSWCRISLGRPNEMRAVVKIIEQLKQKKLI